MEWLFRSFFLGGFECSSHRRKDGRRLDLIASTRHEEHAAADYRRLRGLGIHAARDGIRWHRIETRAGEYDWSSALPLVRAARDTGVQVVWDLCHYGWPDGLDIWSPEWVRRFGRFARAFAELVRDESDEVPFYAPVNEISFFSWAGGSVGHISPCARRRGTELKRQLVRGAIEGIEGVWEADPRARIVHPDPVIHITAHPDRPRDARAAARHTATQWHAWDMLAGRRDQELGGRPEYLDIVGVNYYWNNQWFHNGAPVPLRHPSYRPFREILREVQQRYGRPTFLAETGIEGRRRAAWLRYIGREVRAAIRAGVPVGGVCWYPIVNHPGWDDDRHCPNGLWAYPDEAGERPEYKPLVAELQRQRRLVARLRRPSRVE